MDDNIFIDNGGVLLKEDDDLSSEELSSIYEGGECIE